jgi:hypothetical protein
MSSAKKDLKVTKRKKDESEDDSNHAPSKKKVKTER